MVLPTPKTTTNNFDAPTRGQSTKSYSHLPSQTPQIIIFPKERSQILGQLERIVDKIPKQFGSEKRILLRGDYVPQLTKLLEGKYVLISEADLDEKPEYILKPDFYELHITRDNIPYLAPLNNTKSKHNPDWFTFFGQALFNLHEEPLNDEQRSGYVYATEKGLRLGEITK